MPVARRFHHVAGLDGLRGVAVLLVIGLHFGELWAHSRPGGLLPGGYVGVDIFFVLSGFLITSLLVDEHARGRGVGFRKFYARRALRLLPALYVVLLAHLLYTIAIGESLRNEAKAITSVVFYVANFAQIYGLKSMIRGGIGLTWSLAIEEQFYFLWPALLTVIVLPYARSRTSILVIIAGSALVSAVTRAAVWNFGSGYPAAYMRLDCRADGLLLGALCAFLWRWDLVPKRWLNWAWLPSAAFIAYLAVFVRADDFMFDYGFALVSLAAAVLVLAIANRSACVATAMEWTPLRALGHVSYGAYLWHGLAMRIVVHTLHTTNRAELLVAAIALSGALVTASWFLVEQPFLRLKQKVASPVPH